MPLFAAFETWRRESEAAARLPRLWAELALASWETIARRSTMIAAGTCTPVEYSRMVSEKLLALHRTSQVFMAGAFGASAADEVLRHWHRPATANSRRLRTRR